MKKIYLIILGLLGIQLFFLANLQFTAWPEMFSYPYLRNNTFLIYRDMIHPYPPFLTMALSWIYSLVGYDLWVLKATAWLVALATSILVFLITREITKENKPALISLALFVLFQPFLEGNMLWFDLAIMPSLLLSLLFLLRKDLFLAGLFIAITMLIKQTTGLFFIAAIGYLLFVQKTSFEQLRKFFYGSLILGVPFLVKLLQEGALGDFINWVLIYPLTKWGNIIGYVQMEMSTRQTIVILVLVAPIIFKLVELWRDQKARLLLLYLGCALIAVYPRFSFFHFQAALALILILYGFILSKFKVNLKFLPLYLLIFIPLVHYPVITQSWQTEPRFYAQRDLELAEVINSKVNGNNKVYLLGLHSGLYLMSETIPPERWTDNFAWYLEIPGVQEEVIGRWERNWPTYIIWRTPTSGNPFDLATYQPGKITQWIKANFSRKEEISPGVWLWEKNQ